ncbi:ADP-ribosylglycohydrolase family protein [Pseudonocardia adelaidensis]|uniref:ADP-ribosylglycohydrolase n=1 Tax=Pseudonocardia adelaidensis TaxID=648754 RepID=A0ABP9NYN9_9PSEU
MIDPQQRRSRARGCLLAGAVGDALGAPVEFDAYAGIRSRFGPAGVTDLVPSPYGAPGLVTDDTQMTLFTAEALLDTDPPGLDDRSTPLTSAGSSPRSGPPRPTTPSASPPSPGSTPCAPRATRACPGSAPRSAAPSRRR